MEVYTGAQALERLNDHHSLLVCAWTLPDMTAVDLAQQLRERRARVPVMVFARSSRIENVVAALRAGCESYVWKGSDVAELGRALTNRTRGLPYVPPHLDTALLRDLLDRPKTQRPLELLTVRQKEILSLLAEGLRVADIAKRLGLSPKTVETHRAMIRKRTGCATLAALTVFATVNGMTASAAW